MRNFVSKQNLTGAILIAVFASSLTLFTYLANSINPQKELSTIDNAVQTGSLSTLDYPILRFRMTQIATEDNYSNCIEIGHSVIQDRLPFSKHLETKTLLNSMCSNILNATKSTEDTTVINARFFHGTSALLRILLSLISYFQLQVLISIMLLFLATWMTFEFAKKDKFLGLILGIFFFLLTDIPFQGLSPVHGISTCIGLGGALYVLKFLNLNKSNLLLTIFLLGGLYGFFAQFFTPALFAILLASVILVRTDKNTERYLAAKVFLSYLFGYFFIEFIRFIQTALILGFKQIGTEGGQGVNERLTHNPLQLIRITYMHLFVTTGQFPVRMVGIYLIFGILGFQIGLLGAKNAVAHAGNPEFLPFWLSISWYLLFAGHDGHGWVFNLIGGTICYLLITIRLLKTQSRL